MKLARWVRGGGSVEEGRAKGAKGGKALVLTRDSFRGFRRTHRDAEGRGGFYVDGVWLVTRPRTMCGLDAKVRCYSRFFWFSSTCVVWFFRFGSDSGGLVRFWSTYLGRDSAGSARILRGERVLHSLTDI